MPPSSPIQASAASLPRLTAWLQNGLYGYGSRYQRCSCSAAPFATSTAQARTSPSSTTKPSPSKGKSVPTPLPALSTLPPLLPDQFRISIREMRPEEVTLAAAKSITSSDARTWLKPEVLLTIPQPKPTAMPDWLKEQVAVQTTQQQQQQQQDNAATPAQSSTAPVLPPSSSPSPSRSSNAHKVWSAPTNLFVKWLQNFGGIKVAQQARLLSSSLSHQSHHDNFTRFCGFGTLLSSSSSSPSAAAGENSANASTTTTSTDSSLTYIELSALHLWLLHVRLRNENMNSSLKLGKLIRLLFELFWQDMRRVLEDQKFRAGARVLHELSEVIYGGWIANDQALVNYVNILAQQEVIHHNKALNASVAEFAQGAVVPEAITDAFGPNFSYASADFALLSSLWRNTFRSSLQLNPHHLAQMRDYTLATIQHLQTFSAEDILDNKFHWLQPPASTITELSSKDKGEVREFYLRAFGTPVAHGMIMTQGVPTLLQGWTSRR